MTQSMAPVSVDDLPVDGLTPVVDRPVVDGRVAAGELAQEHIGLVMHQVRALLARVPAHVDRDDLRSAGLVALVKASQSYRADGGASFATYATARIRGALLDELRSVDWATRSVRRRAREIEETRSRLAEAMGQFPDDAAVAAALGIDADDITRTAYDVDRARVGSLEERDHGDEHVISAFGGLGSQELGPEARVELAERLEYLQAAIAELPARLRRVVEGYFLAEEPMAAIATKLGVTESRVSQMRAEALVMLRDALNANLDPHLVTNATTAGRPAGRPAGLVARRRDTYVAAVAARQLANRHSPATLRPVTLAG